MTDKQKSQKGTTLSFSTEIPKTHDAKGFESIKWTNTDEINNTPPPSVVK